MKANHVKTQSQKNRYYHLYSVRTKQHQRPGIIIKIAEEFDVAPCLVAKLILQKHFDELDVSTELESNGNGNINLYLRDTTLIPDKQLAYEVFLVRSNIL